MPKMAQVNGDLPSVNSVAIQHLLDYPAVHDSVVTFRNNPVGKKSLAFSESAYKTFAEPLLPFFARPWNYLRPYAEKADNLGDQALSAVDERFPVVKKPTEELYAGARGIIALPFRTGFEAKDHVLKTYSQQKKKIGNDNVVALGKAVVSTVIISTSDLIIWVGDVMHYKKEEAKEIANEKINN
ncbi:hypothetical protein LY76DRAFT_48407 [Colletotrichum caudatum]|nr:hypothetical protein LY76DRAFT_48407 [Colletotrichum caudatum]